MDTFSRAKRRNALKTVDTLNAIKGVQVSEYARQLSIQWAAGEITSDQMRHFLMEHHKKIAKVKKTSAK